MGLKDAVEPGAFGGEVGEGEVAPFPEANDEDALAVLGGRQRARR